MCLPGRCKSTKSRNNMTFQPENKLEISLMKAATEPEHRPQFIRDLVESKLFIIQHGDQQPAHERVLEEGYQLLLGNIEANGKKYIPVFSSLKRLQMFINQEVTYMGINTLDLFNVIKGADVILNPGADYGKEFLSHEILSILDGSIWKPNETITIEKPTEVLLGQPSNYPHELVNALSKLFKTIKQVKKAYIAHIYNPEEDEKPHSIIAIEITGNWDEVVSQAGVVTNSIQIPDPPVDFVQITGNGGIEDFFINECKPFYKKKLLGIF